MNSYLVCITEADNLPMAVFVTEEELGILLTNLDRSTFEIIDMMPIAAEKVINFRDFCKPTKELEVGGNEEETK